MTTDLTFKLYQTNSNGSKFLRRHPKYDDYKPEWDFFLECYLNPIDYADKHLFKYFKEGDNEFRERKKRAYRENHTKKVVELINSYLFKAQAKRKIVNDALFNFRENATGNFKSIENFMQHSVARFANLLGRVYVVVDKKNPEVLTGTHLDNIKGMPYCYVVFPQDVLDLSFDDVGNIRWILLKESVRDDENPFESTGEINEQYRLWYGGDWWLFDSNGDEIASGSTGLDETPVIAVDGEEGLDVYNGVSLIKDIAYIDRAIFNNWSRLDVIVNDQTFSQLIIPAEGIIFTDTDEDMKSQILEMATNRVFLYSSQAQVPPKYISPDASQAQFILSMIEKQTKQLYAINGLSGEVASDVKIQSGLAKAYDFDKLNKMLASRASSFEVAERKIFRLASKWMGIDTNNFNEICVIDYPDDFDVRSLADEISYAQEMSLLNISETFEKQIKKNIVYKAFPKLDRDTLKVIEDEIDNGGGFGEVATSFSNDSNIFEGTKFDTLDTIDNTLNQKIKPKQ
jgi:hypothetical protein